MAKANTPTKPVTPSQKATQQVAAKVEAKTEPKVVYPEVKFEVFPNGITMERAKELLGWETEADYIAKLKTVDANLNEDEAKKIFAKDKFLTDMLGNNVALRKNTHNRPWGEGVTNSYVQDLLKHHWEFNGETIIIGKYGHVLSGQHRLIALIFAEQKRTSEKEAIHWEEFWDKPVTMACCIVYGIDESSRVTRTIDNVKSRTLTDVVCADTDLFGDLKLSERKSYARALEYAVKFLWERIGVGDTERDSWAPKRTHSEALSFVDNHAKLKECVKFIMDEERGSDSRISRFIYPGYAAALMYMQSTVGMKDDDIQDYCANRPLDEKHLKFPSLKKAKMFWSELAKGDTSMMKVVLAACPVRGNETDTYTGRVFPTIVNDKRTAGDGSLAEQTGILIKAWNAFVKDEPLENLELTYDVAVDPETGKNVFELQEFPTVHNSIDAGKKKKKVKAPKPESNDESTGEDEPSILDELNDEQGDEIAENEQSKPVTTMKQRWDDDKATYGSNHVLIYQSTLPNSNNWLVMFDDALTWKEVCPDVTPTEQNGVVRVVLDRKEIDRDAAKIQGAGHDILMISRPDVEGNRGVMAYSPEENTESTEPQPQQEETPQQQEVPKPAKVVIKKK